MHVSHLGYAHISFSADGAQHLLRMRCTCMRAACPAYCDRSLHAMNMGKAHRKIHTSNKAPLQPLPCRITKISRSKCCSCCDWAQSPALCQPELTLAGSLTLLPKLTPGYLRASRSATLGWPISGVGIIEQSVHSPVLWHEMDAAQRSSAVSCRVGMTAGRHKGVRMPSLAHAHTCAAS